MSLKKKLILTGCSICLVVTILFVSVYAATTRNVSANSIISIGTTTVSSDVNAKLTFSGVQNYGKGYNSLYFSATDVPSTSTLNLDIIFSGTTSTKPVYFHQSQSTDKISLVGKGFLNRIVIYATITNTSPSIPFGVIFTTTSSSTYLTLTRYYRTKSSSTSNWSGQTQITGTTASHYVGNGYNYQSQLMLIAYANASMTTNSNITLSFTIRLDKK